LHQPPQAWYNHIEEELTLIGYKRSLIDFNLVGKGKYVILLNYVNDLFLTKNTIEEFKRIKKTFTNTFEITLFRNVLLYLGVEIIQTSEGI
jgi:ribosomal protein S8